ncbi:MAG: N-acyl homoserine lactonase family protein [Rhodobacteraceae bacterium]|nr:N-acyl homoserine lactonase family protein [Paracoccaceae bacterium]
MSDWEVLAIHYATTEVENRNISLIQDQHDLPGRLDFFIWVIRNDTACYVVDTGFALDEGARRGREMTRHPCDSLRDIDIDADSIKDVIISHLHYDHAGNMAAFPAAQFHLQEAEMAYGTGKCMCVHHMRKPFHVEDVVTAVRMVYSDRVCFHDGDVRLADGLSLHLIGGHSRGLQVLRVETGDRVIVVASDALHYSHYLDDQNAFPLHADLEEVIAGYDRLRELAGPDGLILPGHDPDVLQRFRPVRPDVPAVLAIK